MICFFIRSLAEFGWIGSKPCGILHGAFLEGKKSRESPKLGQSLGRGCKSSIRNLYGQR